MILCSVFCSEGEKVSSEAVSEYLENKKKYEEMRTQKLKKGSSREAQVRCRRCLTWSSELFQSSR